MADSTATTIASWLNAGRDAALAVDQVYEYGKSGASPAELARDSALWNGLNGSGAVDPQGQVMDAASRDPALNVVSQPKASMLPPWGIAVAAVIAIGILITVLKRR